ncbi:MAG: TRAP transporter small permease [Gammaproteobacteria bacterium]|nr:TRAP transporter small permease [Gammaproteobacteria bacterium]
MRLERVAAALERVEDAVLVLLMGALVALAGAQIVLRNLFDSGLLWADPAVRVLVLWVALLGAMAAARQGRHITVDLVARVLPPRLAAPVRALTDLFAAAVCGLLAWHAARLVAMEWEAGTVAVGGVPTWVAQLIVPAGFAVIGLRYLALAPARFRGPAEGPAPG